MLVQWLGLWACNAGGSVSSIPGWGTKIPHATPCALPKIKMNKRTQTTVVESEVTKHTSEDTQDNGEQFITPAGPRGISSQQGLWWFRGTRFYTLCYMTGYTLVISFTTCRRGRINNYNMQVQTLSLIWDNLTLTSSRCLPPVRRGFPGFSVMMVNKVHGEGNGNPLQYSCLENSMDGGAWWAAVHGVARSRTQLSDFTFTFHFHALEKEMATHSSVLAWRISGMGEPGGLPSMGSHRVRHDWSDLAAAVADRQIEIR